MKAIVFTEYGSPDDVLELKEVEKPAPNEGEVLVKVHAASINYSDWHILRGESFFLRLLNGIRKPKNKILGDDIAGRVELVGSIVKQFQPGDDVFGISNFDAFAEYACASEDSLTLKPASMTFEQAAAIPAAGITALQGVRDKGQVQPGKKVLINGASGGVGSFAVQIAKSFGAQVTGVSSPRKLEMLRSIGADYVIDYTQEDFTSRGQLYDLIFAVGGSRSIFDYRSALSPKGFYVCVGGSMSQYFQGVFLGPLISMTGSQKMGSMLGRPNQKDYDFLIELFEAGKVIPVIDRCYPLSEVPDALRYYGDGNAAGKVVISM